MNNQAAQTMPELPEPFDTVRVNEFSLQEAPVFSAGQMRAMYQQGYAAALSQTAGVAEGLRGEVTGVAHGGFATISVDCSHIGPHYLSEGDTFTLVNDKAAAPAASGGDEPSPNWCTTCQKHRNDPASIFCSNPIHRNKSASQPAAPVSERARELLAAECENSGFRDQAEDLRAGLILGGLPGVALRALEQAMTQQRGAVLDRPARVGGRDFKAGELVQRVVGRAHAEYDRHHGGCLRHPYTGELRDYRDVESDPDGTLCVGPGPLAATTPQPGAEALPKFAVGDRVTWTNKFGTSFPGTIEGWSGPVRYCVALDDGSIAGVAYESELESLLVRGG